MLVCVFIKCDCEVPSIEDTKKIVGCSDLALLDTLATHTRVIAAHLKTRAPKVYAERRHDTLHDFKKIYRFSQTSVDDMARIFFGEESQECRGGALPNLTVVIVLIIS